MQAETYLVTEGDDEPLARFAEYQQALAAALEWSRTENARTYHVWLDTPEWRQELAVVRAGKEV